MGSLATLIDMTLNHRVGRQCWISRNALFFNDSTMLALWCLVCVFSMSVNGLRMRHASMEIRWDVHVQVYMCGCEVGSIVLTYSNSQYAQRTMWSDDPIVSDDILRLCIAYRRNTHNHWMSPHTNTQDCLYIFIICSYYNNIIFYIYLNCIL